MSNKESGIRISQPLGGQTEEAIFNEQVGEGVSVPPMGGKPPHIVAADEIVGRVQHFAHLTEEATKYLESLQKEVTAGLRSKEGVASCVIEVAPIPCSFLNMQRLSCQINNGKKESVLFAFSNDSTVTTCGIGGERPMIPQPVAFHFSNAIERLNETTKGVEICTTFVITQEAYARKDKMVSYLVEMFLSLLIPENRIGKVNLASIPTMRVITSPHIVRREIEERHPTGVIPPIHTGIVIEMEPPHRRRSPYSNDRDGNTFLMAVGATTTFRTTSSSGYPSVVGLDKYRPYITINSVIMATPTLSMALFGIMIAIKHLAANQGWKDQFFNFESGAQNIGNLIPTSEMDNRGNLVPFRVKDRCEVEQFIAERTLPPVVVVDITDGAPRAPGLERLCTDDYCHAVAEFVGGVTTDQIPRGLVPQQPFSPFIQYVGAMAKNFDGDMKTTGDTRHASFLQLMAEGIEVKDLLVHNTDPNFTIQLLVNSLSATVRPLYVNTQVMVDASVSNALYTMMTSGLNLRYDSEVVFINNAGMIPNSETLNYGSTIPMSFYGNQGAYTHGGGPVIYNGIY